MTDKETPDQLKQRKLTEIKLQGEKLLGSHHKVSDQLCGLARISGRLYELKEAGVVTVEESQKIENDLAYRLGFRGGEW